MHIFYILRMVCLFIIRVFRMAKNNKKYNTLYESEVINDFFDSENIKENQKTVYISRIGLYLKWRNFNLEDFLEGLNKDLQKEVNKINEFGHYCKANIGTSYASNVRRFVRYLGHKIDSPLSAIRKREKIIFFDNDPAMKRFLNLFRNNGYSESHTRRANRSLNEFCLWRGKSPSELMNEDMTPQKLTNILLDFKSVRINDNDEFGWKTIKNSSWSLKLQAIQYFYIRIHQDSVQDLLLGKEKKIRNNGEVRGMSKDKRQIIKKEEVRSLLDACSKYRQKAIISGLFESGISISDLLEIRYSQIKDKINIESIEDSPKAISFYHIRQKTKVGFYACFGKNTIHYIALHLKERKQLYQAEIQDEEYVFAVNHQPKTKPNTSALRYVMHSKNKRLGIKKITPHDFRRTFNTLATRTGKLLEYQIRSLMGHLNSSMGQVYDVSKEEEILQDYLAIYDECFNLDYDDAKYKSLEEENNQMRKDLLSMKDQVSSISKGFNWLFEFLDEKDDFSLDDLDGDEMLNFMAILKSIKRKATPQ